MLPNFLEALIGYYDILSKLAAITYRFVLKSKR